MFNSCVPPLSSLYQSLVGEKTTLQPNHPPRPLVNRNCRESVGSYPLRTCGHLCVGFRMEMYWRRDKYRGIHILRCRLPYMITMCRFRIIETESVCRLLLISRPLHPVTWVARGALCQNYTRKRHSVPDDWISSVKRG